MLKNRILRELEMNRSCPISGQALAERYHVSRNAVWKAVNALKEEGYETVFFGGPMDREMVEAAISKMKTKPLVATGKFSIGELAAAMSRCQLIITNDSGPMHVAISQKVPIVAMYGPSHPDLYGPYTKDAIIVKAIPPCDGCRSGMKHHCEDMRCMRQLTVDQVLGAAYTMLRR